MKKSVVNQNPQGSAEWVIAHAIWQRSRGKNPSAAFQNERNPREALRLAVITLKVLRAEGGNDRSNWRPRRPSPVGWLKLLHQIGVEGDDCVYCQKPMSEWKPTEDCPARLTV